MSHFLFLDFFWKILFFVSILSCFYFGFTSVSISIFKQFSLVKKVRATKVALALLLTSFSLLPFHLYFVDHDWVMDCFGKFAAKAGVFGITRSITAIWLLGFIILITKDIMNYFKIKSELKKSVVALNRSSSLLPESHFYEVTNQINPVVVGIFSSQIYIPSRIAQNNLSLQYVLSHELVHQKNKDGLWNLAAMLIHRINWFNPLAYLSFFKFKLQLEMATDEQAIKEFGLNISEYAEHLVNLISSNTLKNALAMNASGDFLQIQSRLFYLRKIQSGNISSQSNYIWFMFITLTVGLSQAYATIKEPEPSGLQRQMCFQVQHEILIESCIMQKNRSEPNMCK